MDATHTFRGRTMSEAVQKLKQAAGPDAVIVSTRRGSDHRGGYVEITASAPAFAEPDSMPAMGGARGATAAYARNAGGGKPAGGAGSGAFAERAAWLARQMRQTSQRPAPVEPPAVMPSPPTPSQSDDLAALKAELDTLRAEREASQIAALRSEIAELRAEVGQPAKPSEVRAEAPDLTSIEARLDAITGLLETRDPDVVERLTARLAEVGINPSHARELARHAVRTVPGATADDGDLLASLGSALAQDVGCTGSLMPQDGERRVLAFVGPTGVGKTTTIAKVAAHAALLQGIPTALVTVDTFRMAAVEQLARYADILECPLHVVKKPEELPAVLAELSETRLVLVDTTGRNPRAADQVNALARFFPQGWGGELVLTVAASTRERDLFTTVDAFAELDIAALCVTKTDETDAIGTTYTLARRAAKPLAWTTHGQRVPEDIEEADAARIAARIVAAAAGRAGVALAS